MEPVKPIGFEIRTLSNLIKRTIDNLPSNKGLENITGLHRWVIKYLYQHREEDLFQRDLEAVFEMRRSTTTAILQLMEKNGLITRQSVPYDARLKKLVLTPKAIQFHESFSAEIERMEARLKSGLSEEELSTFMGIVERMKKNME